MEGLQKVREGKRRIDGEGLGRRRKEGLKVLGRSGRGVNRDDKMMWRGGRCLRKGGKRF